MAAYEAMLAALLVLPLFINSGSKEGFAGILNEKSLVFALVSVTAVEIWAFFELVRRSDGIYVSFASFAALIQGVRFP